MALKLSEDEKVNYIERHRIIETGVSYFTMIYISDKYCRGLVSSDLEQHKSSIYVLEDKYGLEITKVERSLEPIPQGKHKWIAKILNMDKNEWFHYMQSKIFIDNNIPISYYRDFFPGSKSKFILRGNL